MLNRAGANCSCSPNKVISMMTFTRMYYQQIYVEIGQF